MFATKKQYHFPTRWLPLHWLERAFLPDPPPPPTLLSELTERLHAAQHERLRFKEAQDYNEKMVEMYDQRIAWLRVEALAELNRKDQLCVVAPVPGRAA